jgi:hypothetical protein
MEKTLILPRPPLPLVALWGQEVAASRSPPPPHQTSSHRVQRYHHHHLHRNRSALGPIYSKLRFEPFDFPLRVSWSKTGNATAPSSATFAQHACYNVNGLSISCWSYIFSAIKYAVQGYLSRQHPSRSAWISTVTTLPPTQTPRANASPARQVSASTPLQQTTATRGTHFTR